jgi:hypothetical protein
MFGLDPGAVDHGLPTRELLVEERTGSGRAFADRLDAERLPSLRIASTSAVLNVSRTSSGSWCGPNSSFLLVI